MTAATYRYVLCDLRTDQVLIDDLPLTGVSFEDRIGRAGSLSASLPMPNAGLVRLGRIVHEYTGRAALWVYRHHPDTGTRLWWGGIVWTSTPQRGDRGDLSMSVSAATFWSYAHRRYVGKSVNYQQWDQAAIARQLWVEMRVWWSGDIGVRPANMNNHGILRDRIYLVSEFATYGQRLEELGDVIDGPEQWIRVDTDEAGERLKTLIVERRIGEADPVAVFSLSEHGGSILTWSEPTDATEAGTAFRARGSAPEANAAVEQLPLMSELVQLTELMERGWPRIDYWTDHSDVSVKATLDSYALANLAARPAQITTSSCTVRVEGTDWRPQLLGSSVRLRFADAWHNSPVDQIVRPVAYKATPSDRTGQERVELIYDERGAL